MTVDIAVLASGRGSNLRAIVERVHHAPAVAGRIVLVLTSRPGTGAERIAREAGLQIDVVDHRRFETRAAFDDALAARIEDAGASLVVLAGFMRILTDAFVARFSPRLLNIHPSLLPAYPGLRTHARAIENGETEAGASVHVVVPELDAGPVIARARVRVAGDDDEDSLAARVLTAEHLLLPTVLGWVCDGRLRLDETAPCLDGSALGPTGRDFDWLDGRLDACSA